MKKLLAFFYVVSSWYVSAQSSFTKPFTLNNLASILIDKIFITIPMDKVHPIVYQIAKDLIVQQQAAGASLAALVQKQPTLENLVQNGQLPFNPLDKGLFPQVILTVQDPAINKAELTQSITLISSLAAEGLNYRALLYIKPLITYLTQPEAPAKKGKFSMGTAATQKEVLLYANKPVALVLNIEIDFNGGHFHSINFYQINGQNQQDLIIKIDGATLIEKGIVIEYYA